MKNVNAKKTAPGEQDIIPLIIEDHQPLKKFIGILKDKRSSFSEKTEAFSEFAPLLKNHSQSEEDSLYVFLKKETPLIAEAFEGDVDHKLADHLLEEIKIVEEENLWMAQVKVLADLVENHLAQEEDTLLPLLKKHTNQEQREHLGQKFLELKRSHDVLDAIHPVYNEEKPPHIQH